MLLRWLFATVHLLALGIGTGAIWVRGRSLSGAVDQSSGGRYFERVPGVSAVFEIRNSSMAPLNA